MFNKLKDLKKLNLIKLLSLEKIERRMIYILCFVAFIVVNLLISLFSARIDLSYGKAYTLSPSTIKILKNTDDLVTIKFFVSSDLPTRLLPLKTEAIDLLNEYKKASSKVNVKILDPKKDEKALNEAKELGIPELQFSQLDQDKYAVTASYFGVALNFGDKKEIIPQITDVGSLEYNLTSTIYKLTKKEAVRVGVIGRGEDVSPQTNQFASFDSILSQQFELNNLDLSKLQDNKIDNSLKTLVIIDDDKKSYDDKEIKAIKDYLQTGGKVLVFADGVWVAETLETSEAKHDLFPIFDDFGIKLNKDLVLSSSAELVNFGNTNMSFLTPYPFWLKTNNFNNKSSYFSNINQLTFPWVSSLSIDKKANINAQELIKSNNKSWEQKENFVLNPNNIPPPEQSQIKEYLLAADAKNNKGGELVVIPSSRFVQERFLSRSSGNLELVLNLLNNMASGGALSGIRSRAIFVYPLPELPEGQKDLFKYLNILLLPTILAVFGGVRLMKRK